MFHHTISTPSPSHSARFGYTPVPHYPSQSLISCHIWLHTSPILSLSHPARFGYSPVPHYPSHILPDLVTHQSHTIPLISCQIWLHTSSTLSLSHLLDLVTHQSHIIPLTSARFHHTSPTLSLHTSARFHHTSPTLSPSHLCQTWLDTIPHCPFTPLPDFVTPVPHYPPHISARFGYTPVRHYPPNICQIWLHQNQSHAEPPHLPDLVTP